MIEKVLIITATCSLFFLSGIMLGIIIHRHKGRSL